MSSLQFLLIASFYRGLRGENIPKISADPIHRCVLVFFSQLEAKFGSIRRSQMRDNDGVGEMETAKMCAIESSAIYRACVGWKARNMYDDVCRARAQGRKSKYGNEQHICGLGETASGACGAVDGNLCCAEVRIFSRRWSHSASYSVRYLLTRSSYHDSEKTGSRRGRKNTHT